MPAAAEVLTSPKTHPDRSFTVLSEMLGLHVYPDGSARATPPMRGDTVTLAELKAVGADVDMLIARKAIEPRIILPEDLPEIAPAVDRSPVPPKDMITAAAKGPVKLT